jgi:flagellar motor protein MotB
MDDLSSEEGAGPWPAFADLMSATTLLFLVLFAVIAIPAINAASGARQKESTIIKLDSVLRRSQFAVRKPGDYLIITIGGADTFPQKHWELESLNPGTRQTLTRLASALKANDGDKPILDEIDQIHVVGHTSSEGGDEYNWRLSSNRAATVALFLMGEGLPACKVTALGRGRYYPVDAATAHATSKASPLDRRIEIEIRPLVPSDTAQENQRKRCVEAPGDSVRMHKAA